MSKQTLLEKPNVQQQEISVPPKDTCSGFEHVGVTMRRMFENLARYGDMLSEDDPRGRSPERPRRPV